MSLAGGVYPSELAVQGDVPRVGPDSSHRLHEPSNDLLPADLPALGDLIAMERSQRRA